MFIQVYQTEMYSGVKKFEHAPEIQAYYILGKCSGAIYVDVDVVKIVNNIK